MYYVGEYAKVIKVYRINKQTGSTYFVEVVKFTKECISVTH